MIPKKIVNYLEKAGTEYETIDHRKVYTAFDAASTMRVELASVAKNLLIKTGSKYAMAVLQAGRNVDLDKLAKAAEAKKATIPGEKAMMTNFKIKPGAMAAFGGVYKIPVFLDAALAKQSKAVFSSGSHTSSVKMKVGHFRELENPVVASFGVARKKKKA